MRRTTTHLSDGRELRYFDFDDDPPRTASDERGLPPGSTSQGRMRFDHLTGEWIAIAGHRQERIFLPSQSDCPLCPTTSGNLSEIPERDYRVVVFENRFPSFLDENVPGDGAADAIPAFGADLPAYGRCEVVAFSPDHHGSIGALDADQMGLVMAAWRDRTESLLQQPGVRFVFVFENRGSEIGVTLHHPHGQIYAYPYVPPWARNMLDVAGLRSDGSDQSHLRSIVAFEREQATRIVHADDHWVAFVPYASRWPFEVQVHPIADRRSLAELTTEEQDSFSASYPRLIRALDSLFDAPLPYMSGWIQVPAHPTADELRDSRLFLRLVSNRRAGDKLKFLAGSESLMGAFIGDVVPEDAAERIRAALAVSR